MLQLLLRLTAAALAVAAFGALAMTTAEISRAVADARKRWEESPYGPMLARILPPGFDARQMPEPEAPGAALVARYCVQCHNLPNPAMHEAAKWPKIVDRMVARMEGHGNMGPLMRELMAGVSAPTAAQGAALLAYLEKHAQRPLDPAQYPDLAREDAKAFRIACQQCHALPDPQRYTAGEWRRVVARMERNMAWMNRVVGSQVDPREPQLRVEDINAWLARHAKRG
jgi:cytochrome c2